MKLVLNNSKKSIMISLVSILILLVVMAVLFLFDDSLSSSALKYSDLAENEEIKLGEFFQLVRLFGKADVLVFIAICLGLSGKRRLCKQIVLSLILVGLLVHPVKSIVQRERPNHSSHTSFPSGDTATAFILPEIMTMSTTSVVASSIVATGVAFSRIFYGMHYPSDVVAGAAVGLFAGCLGVWLSRKIRWLPSINQLLLAMVVFMLYLAISGLYDMHHRHNLQFIVWYFPALILYMLRPYIACEYSVKVKSLLGGKLYYLFKNSLIGCSVVGWLLLVIPWFSLANGLRAPFVSAGLVLIVFSFYARKELRAERLQSVIAFTAVFLLVAQLWSVGYLLDKF